MAGRRRILEILTGAGTLIVLAALFVVSYASDEIAAAGGQHLIARFRNIDGLAVGSEVRLAGIPVGTVWSQRFDPATRQAVVTLRITHPVQIPVDSAAMIISESILGSKFLRIEPGGADEYFKDGGQFEFVQNSVSLADVLQTLINEVEAARREERRRNEAPD